MKRLRSSLISSALFLAMFTGVVRFMEVAVPAAQAFPHAAAPQTPQPDQLKLPLLPQSVRFAVIGDSGTGDREEFEVAQVLNSYHDKVQYDFVIMLGDNLYGGHSPRDFSRKFEEPFKPLLDAGVKFYASLGNHDDPNAERLYKPFNMGGERYYTFKRGNVAFFVLDSNYMDPPQLTWFEEKLKASKEKWKICYFHHPLYNGGKSHGPDLDLRAQLLPLFKKYGVNAVFSGHEHVYERIKPRDGIYYFVLGNSAKLMTHDFRESDEMDEAFDSDRGFMLVEITDDNIFFQTISRENKTIDAGTYNRQATPKVSAANAK